MKERLIGAAVLIAVAVMAIPAFLDGPAAPATVSRELELPAPQPAAAAGVVSDSMRTHTIDLVDRPPAPEPELTVARTSAPPVAPPPAVPAAQPAPDLQPESDRQPEPELPSAPPADGWAVQVGSFASESNAKRLSEYLKAARYPAFVVRNVVNGRVMFRVRVGPEPDRQRAEALAERLRSDRQQTQLVSHP